jgi:hypothetical protein
MTPRGTILHLAKMVGQDMARGTPSQGALAAGPMLAQTGATPDLVALLVAEATKKRPTARTQPGSANSWPPHARTRGRVTRTLPPWKPIGPVVRPQRCARRPPPRPCRGPHSAATSASIIAPSASSPAAKQSRSKLALISASAVLNPGDTTPLPAVLFLFVALLASHGVNTPSLSAQGGQRRSRFLNISRDSAHGWRRVGNHGLLRNSAHLHLFCYAMHLRRAERLTS